MPKVVKSQDLTKSWISENLATGSALINWWTAAERSGENSNDLRSSPHSLGGDGEFLETGGVIPGFHSAEGQTVQLLLLPYG